MISNPPMSFTDFVAIKDNANIRTRKVANNYFELEAWTGAAWSPVLRVTNGATPTIELVGVGLLFANVSPGIEGMVSYNGATHKLQVRTNAGVETITSA